jgi:hypothetical protein
MAWNRKPSTTTKHTCGGPVFGRLSPKECPRCFELSVGAPAVQWRKSADAIRCEEIRAHFRSERHLSGGCGVVCTFGEW